MSSTPRRGHGPTGTAPTDPTPGSARRAVAAPPSLGERLRERVPSLPTISPQLGKRVVRITVPAIAALALAGTVASGAVLNNRPLSAEPVVEAAAGPTDAPSPSSGESATESPSPSASPQRKEQSPQALPEIKPEKSKVTLVKDQVTGQRYATADVNVRDEASVEAEAVASLGTGEEVDVTDATEGEWQQVVIDAEPEWVKSEFLAEEPPPEPTSSTTPESSATPEGRSNAEGDADDEAADSSGGSSDSTGSGGDSRQSASGRGSSGDGSSGPGTGGSCTRSLGSKAGLSSAASRTWDAVCANFPNISTIGGVRNDPGSNHHSGRAIDVMVSGEAGWEIANWARANASSLGVTEVIYAQRIWTTQRSGEGWRAMSDRGSATQNHYDHVHISTN